MVNVGGVHGHAGLAGDIAEQGAVASVEGLLARPWCGEELPDGRPLEDERPAIDARGRGAGLGEDGSVTTFDGRIGDPQRP